MAAPTPSQWYRLTNAFTGPNLALDVVNDDGSASSGVLQMSSSGNFSGQYWQLTPYPTSSSSTYALFTMFLGANKRLDVYGDDATKPHLGDAGNYSGQIWTISPWGDGTWQLWNQYSGSGLHLDTYSDTKVPFMGDGDHSGQHWTFTFIQSTSSNSIPGTSPSSITSSLSSSTTNTSRSKAPTNAIIGGAVGGGVALIALICLVAFLLRKRKRTEFGPGKELFHETEFSTTAPIVSDTNRPPNAMTTLSIVSSTSPTSLLHTPPLAVVPASPTTATPPFMENSREYQYYMHEPEISDSTTLATPSQTTPSVFSSSSLSPLSDRHLSDNQATFLAGLLRQGMSASDVPRILENMGEDGQAHHKITTNSHHPPAYDFKNT